MSFGDTAVGAVDQVLDRTAVREIDAEQGCFYSKASAG
jgi:hypothetical protein